MVEIHKNLFIGNDADCEECMEKPDFAIVHACKSCYENGLKYSGSLPETHPEYLVYEEGNSIYLNLLDMPNEFLTKYTHPIFGRTMEFVHREIKTKKVLVHCNYGMSRSPSLGLVYLAITGVIANDSCEAAVHDFVKLYPKYSPGTGIMLYMHHNWDFLMEELIKT